MIVNKKLYSEIEDYCVLNELDISTTLNKALRSGFTVLQFGNSPNKTETKEVIVEVIKEVKVSDDSKIKELLNEIDILKTKNLELNTTLGKNIKSNKLDLYGE